MIRVLWPQTRWEDDYAPELWGLGDGIQAEFVSRFEDVTEAQWRNCDGIVGASPPLQYLPLLDKCRIYAKAAVGYDEIDLQAWGELGIAVCNNPNYGTREVADHAMALMLTLTKSIAFHDQSLREDPWVTGGRHSTPLVSASLTAPSGLSASDGLVGPPRSEPKPLIWTWCFMTPTSPTDLI
jgi:phosphoglycerate dehydrogenase-like enzyme